MDLCPGEDVRNSSWGTLGQLRGNDVYEEDGYGCQLFTPSDSRGQRHDL